ncbi:MAG: CvpA family protein [Gammaproteobacteria bacterium]|nr:CvpA family protein [Gammaproteobacteria bacterium]
MNWIDILVLTALAVSIGIGFWRGFIHETLSLVAWIAAFIIARVFAPEVAHWLEDFIESQALILLLSWIIPFLSTFIVFNLLKIILISVISLAGLRPIDRVLGAAFGAVKGAFLVTATVLVIQLVLSRSGEPFKTESKLVPHFQVIALWMLKTLDQETKLSLDNVIGRLGRVINSGVENIDLDAWQKKIGITEEDVRSILEDEEKLEQLTALINNPQALEELKSTMKKID